MTDQPRLTDAARAAIIGANSLTPAERVTTPVRDDVALLKSLMAQMDTVTGEGCSRHDSTIANVVADILDIMLRERSR